MLSGRQQGGLLAGVAVAGLLSGSVQFSARSGRTFGGTNRCAAAGWIRGIQEIWSWGRRCQLLLNEDLARSCTTRRDIRKYRARKGKIEPRTRIGREHGLCTPSSSTAYVFLQLDTSGAESRACPGRAAGCFCAQTYPRSARLTLASDWHASGQLHQASVMVARGPRYLDNELPAMRAENAGSGPAR
jgi:hypothetical protein